MDHHVENGKLTILVDTDTIAELRQAKRDDPDHFDSDAFMFDFLEPLIANSELEWIGPEEIGDLTDAPMLGIRNYNTNNVTDRWAFMDYQIISVQQRLIDDGKAVFIGGNTEPETLGPQAKPYETLNLHHSRRRKDVQDH